MSNTRKQDDELNSTHKLASAPFIQTVSDYPPPNTRIKVLTPLGRHTEADIITTHPIIVSRDPSGKTNITIAPPSNSLDTDPLDEALRAVRGGALHYLKLNEEEEDRPRSTPCASCCSWAWNIIKKPIAGTFAVVSSFSTAIYTGLYATESQPGDISINWLQSLSSTEIAKTAIYGVSSLAANTAQTYDSLVKFLTSSASNSKNYIERYQKHCCKTYGATMGGAVFGTTAAVASFGLAITSYAFLPIGWEISATALSTLAYLVTRYRGAKNFILTVQGRFNDKINTLENAAYLLRNLNSDYYEKVQEMIAKKATENGFSDEALKNIFEELNALQTSSEGALIFPISKLQRRLLSHADIAFALLLATCVFPTFMQKGIDGINNLFKLKDLAKHVQIAEGSLPGAASAMLYGVSGWKFRRVFLDVLSELYTNLHWKEFCKKPKAVIWLFFKFLLIVGANGISSVSMITVGEGILKRADRICQFLDSDGTLGQAYVKANQAGAGIVNIISSFNLFLNNEKDISGLIKCLRNKDVNNLPSTATLEEIEKFVASPPPSNQYKHSHNRHKLFPSAHPKTPSAVPLLTHIDEEVEGQEMQEFDTNREDRAHTSLPPSP